MRGPAGAMTAVCGHLEARLPPLLETAQLDKVQKYTTWHTPFAQIEPGQWPALNVVCLRSFVANWADHDDAGGPEWRIGYQLRIFIWVRGQGFEQTTTRRDAYAGCVAEAVMGWPQVDEITVLDPGSVAMSLSDVEQVDDRGGGSIAAAYLEVIAMVAETVELEPAGTADTIDVVVHPAL